MPGRLPDFLIAGAPRCGTTWLATALDRHPQVWLARPMRPEPKFFLVDEVYARGLAAYSAQWFSEAPRDGVVGEKSTNYLESRAAARRIARDLPDVRLIFVLREPVARAVSNYRWSVMNGLEDLDFEKAIELEDRRDASLAPELRYARPHAYLSRGRYAGLLAPYFQHFPREQILVLRFEDLVADPAATTAEAHSFLGVASRRELGGQPEGVNPSALDWEPDPETLRRLAAEFAPWNRRLAELVGSDFTPWDQGG